MRTTSSFSLLPCPLWPVVFVDRHTLRASVAQGLFYGGSGRRAVAHTRPTFPKNAYGPVGIPLIRGASGAGRRTQPPRREWKPGGKAPWGRKTPPGTETHSARSAPRQHGRPKCYPAPGEVQSEINLSPKWSGPGPDCTGLWPGVVAPDRVLSMTHIELNCVLMQKWIV